MTAIKPKLITLDDAYGALAEVVRVSAIPPPAFIDENFPKQAQFMRDPAKRKAAKCTRRAGKSFGFGRILFQEAWNFAGCTCLYIGLTKATARNIMWKDVLKPLNAKLELGGTFKETLQIAMPNTSEIHLTGADMDAEEMEKVLGGKYRVVIIDEGGSFRIELRKLIYENLEPALADWDGYTVLGGTPTEFTKGLFFDVTRDDHAKREPGWSVHEWSTFDNPYMAVNWKKRVQHLIDTNPRVQETPAYKRMYLGQWVTDEDDLVYKYSFERNYADELPKGSYTYVLGIDLGFNDASAFVLYAYSLSDKTLYTVETYKASGMDITDVANRIKHYQKTYSVYKMIVDGAAKQSIEELKNRYSLPLESADKAGKAEFIEIMNAEFIQGRIKLIGAATLPLATEYRGLVWDKDAWEKRKKREEHPGCENHLADAALYGWRHCYQYLARPAEKKPETPTEQINAWEQAEADRVANDYKKPFWET